MFLSVSLVHTMAVIIMWFVSIASAPVLLVAGAVELLFAAVVNTYYILIKS